MQRLIGAVAAIFTLSFATVFSAQAETLGRTLARTGLVQEDINIMTRAGASLYASGNAQVGSDAIWSNPETQAFGMVEVLEVDADCVRIAHRFRTQQRQATQTVTSRRCLVDNRWILSE
jgi:hypothetical protein